MPFQWVAYLELADNLAQGNPPQDTEAALRSAVSRAYYAAYHHAARFCQHHKRPLKGSGGDHQLVRDYLDVMGYPNEARYLLELHRWRKEADYEDQASIDLKWMWHGARSRATSVIASLQ